MPFRDFYPLYLSQRANRTCRRLHFAGTFAWAGHFFFEKNRPAPLLTGRIRF